jgi:hypothetical protein
VENVTSGGSKGKSAGNEIWNRRIAGEYGPSARYARHCINRLADVAERGREFADPQNPLALCSYLS